MSRLHAQKISNEKFRKCHKTLWPTEDKGLNWRGDRGFGEESKGNCYFLLVHLP